MKNIGPKKKNKNKSYQKNKKVEIINAKKLRKKN